MLSTCRWLRKHGCLRFKPVTDFATRVHIFARLLNIVDILFDCLIGLSLINILGHDSSHITSAGLSTKRWLFLELDVLANRI